ncbi:MAG: FIST C-terminal domain-containing protein [Gammaproteobacteria bacterium]|nr:FIST C-terminal domain-containing protein [Gammaproteobacteria bacterium]MBU1724470.1 FIST C-terminal domain-containing protein [Gammaproteobacteria bacterium]MBU2004192.1 FIST C-terminal domain-containing protein [Gammaproteobacteria bacterium]
MLSLQPHAQLFVETSGSCDGLFSLLDRAVSSGAQSLLVLAADANGFTPEQLDARLQAQPIPVFGGIFPEIVADGQILKQGSLVCALPVAAHVHHIENLSDPDADYFPAAELLAVKIRAGSTLITLVDGLSKRIAALLENLYEVFGSRYRYLGGGAGSLSFEQKPCLISNRGLVMDCAQITALPASVSLGIDHGWHKFAGPFFVTGAYDNTITTIDYKPAFEVYRAVVEADSGQQFGEDNFFDLAKAYPFGLDRLSGDVVVRDPLFRDGNKLVCVGEVPANHIIYILKGEADSLLQASQRCAQSAQTDAPLIVALLFDCISRTLFLQERFIEEVDNIHSTLPSGVPLAGGLSLGEIADAGNTCLEFFNKTAVLGVLTYREQDE